MLEAWQRSPQPATMPARRTQKTDDIKRRILNRLYNGFYQPGDRFLSNRDVVELFGVSYQTAHRLIAELCDEGAAGAAAAVGHVCAGRLAVARRHAARIRRCGPSMPRASAPSCWGSSSAGLELERIDFRLSVDDHLPALAADRLPIIWEVPAAVEKAIEHRRAAVLINDRPRVGLASLFVDSVSTDDYAGGACAAQVLQSHTAARTGFAVLSAARRRCAQPAARRWLSFSAAGHGGVGR